MTTELNALLPFILIGLVVLVVAVWLIAKANRKTTVIDDGSIKQDVLDEGAERARRIHRRQCQVMLLQAAQLLGSQAVVAGGGGQACRPWQCQHECGQFHPAAVVQAGMMTCRLVGSNRGCVLPCAALSQLAA